MLLRLLALQISDLLHPASDLLFSSSFREKEMESNCGSVNITTLQQSLLMCAGGEAALAASLVKAQLAVSAIFQEYMKLLTSQPKLRGNEHISCPCKPEDGEDDGDDNSDEDDDEDDADEEEDTSPAEGNKSGDKNGLGGGAGGGPEENGEDEDEVEGVEGEDPNDDDEDDDDDDDDDDEDEEDEDEGEDEEEEDEDEEALQPPKKRKK